MAVMDNYGEIWVAFFRFIREPFRSFAWAVGYVGVALTLMAAEFLFVRGPQPVPPGVEGHFVALTNQLMGVFTLLFLVPAVAFNLVGLAGAVWCVVRDFREARDR